MTWFWLKEYPDDWERCWRCSGCDTGVFWTAILDAEDQSPVAQAVRAQRENVSWGDLWLCRECGGTKVTKAIGRRVWNYWGRVLRWEWKK